MHPAPESPDCSTRAQGGKQIHSGLAAARAQHPAASVQIVFQALNLPLGAALSWCCCLATHGPCHGGSFSAPFASLSRIFCSC